MSLTPSRIELTCEFIPSILSGSIGVCDVRVLSSSLRHWLPRPHWLRPSSWLRAPTAVRRPPTRDERRIRVHLTRLPSTTPPSDGGQPPPGGVQPGAPL